MTRSVQTIAAINALAVVSAGTAVNVQTVKDFKVNNECRWVQSDNSCLEYIYFGQIGI
jgi:hypothetical protein